ncbi:MAG: biopolymer transporter ExbD [Ignavibacteriales bacterium]|nr:biopolymer transporter ExbD [Ignavibacteriales bacterium]
MAKHKKGRVGIKMDMTPMVDVAFLLLTFFMLTTTFKPAEEVQIDLPSSNSEFKLPESDILMITISKDGRIFMGVDSQILRGRLFGEENKFRAGVLVDKQQLGNLVIQARIANPKLRTVVKGDKGAPYGPVEDVMDVLQKARVTRFNLITDLERS